MTDDEFAFDPVMVGAIVEEHGFRLVSLHPPLLVKIVDVCILVMVLFMLTQLKMHVESLSRKRKKNLQ
jgi:hypothetical protein